MRLAIILLSICCFCINGNTSAHAATYRSSIVHAHLPQNDHKPLRHHSKADKIRSVYETWSLSIKEECLHNDEDVEEDEDHNGSEQFQDRHLVQKQVLYQHRLSYIASSFPSIVNYHCSYLKFSLFPFGHASDKYLLLGVLRI